MCLTLIPSSTQGIRSEVNSRNPTILPLKHLQKALQITPADPNNQDSQQPNNLAGDTYRQAQSASRSPGGGHVPQGTKRLKKIPILQIPPAGLPLPPGARVSGVTVVADIAWRKLSIVRCLKSNHPLDQRYRLTVHTSSPGAMTVFAKILVSTTVQAHLLTLHLSDYLPIIL